MKIFKNGLITGLILQLAIGPVFFYIINLSLQVSLLNGLAGVLAVTLVDYFYIILAILGVGKLLEKPPIKKTFSYISSIVLIIFGLIIIANIILAPGVHDKVNVSSANLLSSFLSVGFLTISSPMTIVFFTSLFTAKAFEYNYTKRELFIFGLATGLATLLFMGTSVIIISLFAGTIPLKLIQFANLLVGCLLIVYGGARLKKITNQTI